MKKIICHIKENNEMFSKVFCIFKTLVICIGISFLTGSMVMAAAQAQTRFASPENAVSSLATVLKGDDLQALKSIFGSDADELISSGDEVADKYGRERFLQLFDEKNQLVKESGEKALLEIGKDGWLFPIPLIKDKNGWVFDTKSGKEEILNRRIGRNELDTIQTLLAIVDAQREFAMKDYNKDGILEYAEKFKSEPGKYNGLYWESGDLEAQSPLGPLVAKAKEEQYAVKGNQENPQPYHGYFFKMLKKQGASAPGGVFDYVVNGKMIGGFAVISYPAQYGNSGVVTFMASHDGAVYQKDLGPDTEKIAKKIDIFNPDNTWQKVEFPDNPKQK
ncbi:MAG: DUF2950 domain-containing protein [Candidatus Omnitrophica bacterium]|nr:DUF2950 domain-containing protein [Candidatus Omnitrophota bacterium]